MARAAAARGPTGNRLLDGLPPDSLAGLLPHLKPVTLALDEVLQVARTPAAFAYFPTTAVVSGLTVMEDGRAIEVGNVGNDGVAPASAFLGVTSQSLQTIIQVPGAALRVGIDALAREAGPDGPLLRRLIRYQTFFTAQVAQSVACNGLHSVSQRCCRWLLMTHDRVAGDELTLKHEFVALMLGVRRASVTLVLQPLQEHGLIEIGRGHVTVRDRAGLEAAACECNQAVRDEYDRLLG